MALEISQLHAAKKETQVVCLRFAMGAPRRCRWTLILNQERFKVVAFRSHQVHPAASGRTGNGDARNSDALGRNPGFQCWFKNLRILANTAGDNLGQARRTA
jgi:hypothetical protein